MSTKRSLSGNWNRKPALTSVAVMRETVLAYSPQGRVSEPEEIAALVMFLGSDLSPFINGAVFPIDGGQTAH